MSTKINVAECIAWLRHGSPYSGGDPRQDAARALELLSKFYTNTQRIWQANTNDEANEANEYATTAEDAIAAELDLGGIGAKE